MKEPDHRCIRSDGTYTGHLVQSVVRKCINDCHAVGMDKILSDLEIGHAAHLLPIEEVAASAGIAAGHLEHYGAYIAKVTPEATTALSDQAPAKYIVITAVT